MKKLFTIIFIFLTGCHTLTAPKILIEKKLPLPTYTEEETTQQPYSNFIEATKINNENFEKFLPIIQKVSKQHGVCPTLVKSVIAAESAFNPQARSKKGAIGLMQLMPRTAKSLRVNPKIPTQNIEGGVKYLSFLLTHFEDDTKLALAGYNAGPGAVQRYKGIPPFKETKKYVQRVLKYQEMLVSEGSIDCP